MTLPIRALVSGLIVALATGVTTLAQSPTPAAYKAEEPANRSLDATLYTQIAAEYRASCYQAYALATARLGRMVQDATGQPEQQRKRAVIMDLDETVLDNSHFQAMLLRHDLAWDKGLWATWEREYSSEVGLIPGAKEFIKKAQEWGVEVFYVSNRNGKYKQQAQDALTRLGIPPKDGDHLKLIADPPPDKDSSNKTDRFKEVRSGYDVLLYVGDNLRDFDDTLRFNLAPDAPGPDLERAIVARQDSVDKLRDNFGKTWIILPNPTYGEWKGPLGRGQKDFDRLLAANFPIPPKPAASGTPKPCLAMPSFAHTIDPAIWAAVIAFVSAAVLFFWRKSLERRSTNRAILAEIGRLLKVVDLHRGWWIKRMAEGDTNYPLIPFSHVVYSKKVANVGALNNRLVGDAVTFYGYLDFINSLQAARPLYGDAKSKEFNQTYLDTLTNFVTKFRNAFPTVGGIT